MILGLGTDLVAVSRVEAVLRRHRARFLDRVFTAGEQAECLARARPAVHLAARLAAKEAAMKALGSGWGAGVRWQDVEVQSAGGDPPRLMLEGAARVRAEARGVRQALVSLSHDGEYALAVVVLADSRE
jgi:holo-[acyl-carrier protein] synthase